MLKAKKSGIRGFQVNEKRYQERAKAEKCIEKSRSSDEKKELGTERERERDRKREWESTGSDELKRKFERRLAAANPAWLKHCRRNIHRILSLSLTLSFAKSTQPSSPLSFSLTRSPLISLLLLPLTTAILLYIRRTERYRHGVPTKPREQ